MLTVMSPKGIYGMRNIFDGHQINCFFWFHARNSKMIQLFNSEKINWRQLTQLNWAFVIFIDLMRWRFDSEVQSDDVSSLPFLTCMSDQCRPPSMWSHSAQCQQSISTKIFALGSQILSQLIDWRRHFRANRWDSWINQVLIKSTTLLMMLIWCGRNLNHQSLDCSDY